ncbi:CHAT domain-containing protein, partial [Erythrobacter donghaensis]|uniref:CHAT domain-containing protein n=1 Tax=Erythrobacter donghaensis TaxID=267135 RepID=UPI0012D9DC8C
VMALTRTELVWHRADIKADEVAEKVSALRRDLNPGEGARGPDAGLAARPSFDRGTAHDLYARLIAPVAATLEGKSHLFIAADGALASLPFGVLVTEAPQAGSDDSDPEVLRATPWFADAHALVQIPSLQSLAYLRRFNTGEGGATGSSPARSTAASAVSATATAKAAPASATSSRAAAVRTAASGFAGFGDPVLSGAAVRRGGRSAGTLPPVDASGLTGRGVTEAGAPLMNPDELRALARLPGTRTELEAVGKLLGAPASAIRLDTAMTEAALRSADLSNVRILHLATHGLTASEAGQRGARSEPGLVFTPPAQATSQDDGYLAASEVLTLNLT